MANPFVRAYAWLAFDRTSGKKTYLAIKTDLEASGQRVLGRIANCVQNDKNHGTVTHIIGMERWMQSRIKVALGEPYIQEEYNGYRPAKDAGWDVLQQTFMETRQMSCDLCEQLDAQTVEQAMTVNHNQFGDLSIGGWLKYLDVHASLTSTGLR